MVKRRGKKKGWKRRWAVLAKSNLLILEVRLNFHDSPHIHHTKTQIVYFRFTLMHAAPQHEKAEKVLMAMSVHSATLSENPVFKRKTEHAFALDTKKVTQLSLSSVHS